MAPEPGRIYTIAVMEDNLEGHNGHNVSQCPRGLLTHASVATALVKRWDGVRVGKSW